MASVGYDAELRRHNEVLREACHIRSQDRVLDIGCGSGQTTREAARVARAGSALGVDVSAPAVERARELAHAEGIRNVTFECADAAVYRFPREHFDVAISRFGTMFFHDPAAAFANIYRALRPAGRLVMMVWQAGERNEWDVTIRQSLGVTGAAPSGLPDPFSLADPATVTELLEGTGFADVTFSHISEPVYYGPDVDAAMDWVRGFAYTSAVLKQLEPTATARTVGRLREALTAHLSNDGVWFNSRAWIVTARRRQSRPIGDNGAVAADDDRTDVFRGASFTGADFTGAKFRDCDLRQVKITDSWLVDVQVSGLVRSLVVNDVDVTAFVEEELDRRHPERVQLREIRTADDYRAMWGTIERLWAATVARAGRLPETALRLRVDDEWSFIETLRHLVFATDKWAGRAILDKPMPYHPLGLPAPGYPPADAAALIIDVDARPSLAEVMEVRDNRLTLVRGIVDGLTDASLEQVCPPLPAPDYPEETLSVGRCLRVIMREECEHRRYAVRDLTTLEEGAPRGLRCPGGRR